MDPVRIARKFLALVQDNFAETETSSQSQQEISCEIADSLFAIFKTLILKPESIEESEALDFEDLNDEYEDENCEVHEQQSQASSYYSDEKKKYNVSKFSLSYMKNVLAFASRGKTFKVIRHRFPRVLYPHYVTRFRQYVEANGTRAQKVMAVRHAVLHKFMDGRVKGLQIHDDDLRRWGLEEAREQKLSSFSASPSWILSFKNQNRICSRKIVRIVSSTYHTEVSSVIETAINFVNNSRNVIGLFDPKNVVNTDQSGFNYEMRSNRTLTIKGEKITFGAVNNKSAATHSYTIQPTISMAGKLIGKLFLCLQEPKGKFGKIVHKKLFQAPNVVVVCSKSGKLSKHLVKQYCTDALMPYIEDQFVLMYDSWSGQVDDELYQEILPEGCLRLQIPPKTTATIQPCDVYFFQQWKIFVKHMFKRVALDNLNYNLHNRNNVIKLQSLVHNQLSSTKFIPMIQYAWYKAGYREEKPENFESVLQVCFKNPDKMCVEDNSPDVCFVCCSWCARFLCFKHFFENYHFHSQTKDETRPALASNESVNSAL